MYEARSVEYIRMYESIVVEFFLRFKIHNIGTCVKTVPGFDIKNLIFTVSMLNYDYETLAMQCHLYLYCARPGQCKNNSRFVDSNLLF